MTSIPVGKHQFSWLLASLLLSVSLAGCIGGSSPAIKFYILDPSSSHAIINSNNQLHVEITAVRLPQYLERPQIVTRADNNRLQLSETHQWGGNLRKNLTRTLAVNLSRALNTTNISIAPYRGVDTPDLLIEVEIIRFEKDSTNKVRLSAQWRITDGNTGKTIVTKMSDLEGQELPADNNYGSIVDSMTELYGDLNLQIAQAITETGAAN